MSFTSTDFERAVVDLDDERYRLMEAGDAGKLASLLDDELIYTHSSGHSDTKLEYLEALRRGDFQYFAVRHSVTSVSSAGTMAVIRGELYADAVIFGVAKQLRGSILAVWRDVGVGPRLVALQSTSLPET